MSEAIDVAATSQGVEPEPELKSVQERVEPGTMKDDEEEGFPESADESPSNKTPTTETKCEIVTEAKCEIAKDIKGQIAKEEKMEDDEDMEEEGEDGGDNKPLRSPNKNENRSSRGKRVSPAAVAEQSDHESISKESEDEQEGGSDQEVVVPEGEGEELGSIPTVAKSLAKLNQRATTIRCFHEMLYETPGTADSRLDFVKRWKGLAIDGDKEAFQEQLAACRVNEFYEIAEKVFGIALPKGLTKQVLIRFFCDLLEKPSKESFGSSALTDASEKRNQRSTAMLFWQQAGVTRNSSVDERVAALHKWVQLDSTGREELAAKKKAAPKRGGKRRKIAKDDEEEEDNEEQGEE